MKKEETYEDILKEIDEIQSRIENKMNEFQNFLKKKDLEFKIMELEEKAFKRDPYLKKKIH
jgi:hypothetical protein